jgi:hypothetical protein
MNYLPLLRFLKHNRQNISSAVVALLTLMVLGTLNSVSAWTVNEQPQFVYVFSPNDRPVCPDGYTDPEYVLDHQYRCKLDTTGGTQ